MGFATLKSFKTKKEAEKYVQHNTEWDKRRLYIFNEPEIGGKDTPWTVCVD